MPEVAPIRLVLANPRGFCAGVVRAIEIVERALRLYGPPVYVRHEIVHNRQVIERLKTQGAIFVNDTDEVPPGAVTVFSAHGVSRDVERRAAARGLDVIDATCPLVRRFTRRDSASPRGARSGPHRPQRPSGGRGHAWPDRRQPARHLDGRRSRALAVADPARIAYVTQTTLSVADTREVIAALHRRFPGILGPDTRDICYATQNRQVAVRALAAIVDRILVAGSANSSNSNRLCEVAESEGIPSWLVEHQDEIDASWLDGVSALGLTAGASAPELLVRAIISRLRRLRPIVVESPERRDGSRSFPLAGAPRRFDVVIAPKLARGPSRKMTAVLTIMPSHANETPHLPGRKVVHVAAAEIVQAF